MKKKLSFFFAALALLLTGQTAVAQTFTVGDLSFTVTDAGAKTVSVSKTDGISGNVVIPSSVTYEGDPYSVTAIPNDAFYNCSAITGITIPASVESVGAWAFGGTALTSITIEDSETNLWWNGASSHPLIGMSENYTLYLGRNLQTESDEKYFENATSVTIGDKVTTINKKLFEGASKLASVTMGSGVTSIGEKAFYLSGRDESITKQTIILGPNVTTIGESAFEGCTHLTSIDLGTKLMDIPVYGFYGCSMLTSITIPASVGSVGKQAFYGTALTSITIEDSETNLWWNGGNSHPLDGMYENYTLYLGRNLQIEDERNYFPGATSVTIGDKVTYINNELFGGASKLASVTMGSGVTSIGKKAFYNSGRDESVAEQTITLGPNVTTIGESAFEGCTHLTSIDLGTKLTDIPVYGFYGCSMLTSITIPASVGSVGKQAFQGTALTSITIEDSETDLWWNGSGSHPLSGMYENYTLYLGRNLQTESDEKYFENATSVTIGDKVTTINNKLFEGASKLASVTMGSGVTSIGENAFRDSGTDVSISEQTITLGPNVTTIGTAAFRGCTHLTSIDLGTKLTEIPEDAFYQCYLLNSITIPASVGAVGAWAFSSTALTSITIEDSDADLWWKGASVHPLYNMSENYTLYLGRNLQIEDARCYFPGATKLTLGEKVTNINNLQFSGQSVLTAVEVPWTVTPMALGDDDFSSSTFTNATLWVPGGTKNLYQAADGWKKFEKMDFASFVVTIKASAHGTLAVADIESKNDIPATTLIDRETDVVFTTTPDTGYELTTFTVNETAATPTEGKYTVENLLADQNVVAAFTPITYTLTYTLAGGSVETANPTTYTIESAAITLNNPTRTGYTFEGWTGTDLTEPTKTVTISAGSFGNRSYTATWKPITYTLTYNLAGGSVATENPATYTIETESFTLNNPTKTGYTFAGWTGTDLTEATTTVTIAKGTIDNRSYTATWTPNPYKVRFNANNGTGTMEDQDFVYDAAQALTTNAFTRNGYTFNGWNTKANGSGTPYADKASVKNLTTEANATVNLYAQWQVITYTLTYDLAGGSVATANPTEYTIETAAFTLTNPTKDHYVFAGWTGTGLSEATVNVTIANGSTGNRSYTATWEKETYAVNLTSNNAALVTLSTAAPQYQDNVVVTIDNSTAAELVEFTVDGVNHLGDLDSDGKYTITNVQADVEVVVNFSSSTTVAVLEQEWATFVANKAVDFFGTGLTAYIVTGRNTAGTAVILEEVSTVPANTPVVLNGTTGSYTIPYVASSATDVSANLLKRGTGSAVNAGTGVSRYVLSAEGATAVFKKIGATPATVPTNKAYLEISESSSAPQLSIEIGGGTTGIFSISGISEQDEIYDMQGRKVEHVSKKGLYIINGKKVVIK